MGNTIPVIVHIVAIALIFWGVRRVTKFQDRRLGALLIAVGVVVLGVYYWDITFNAQLIPD